MTRTVEDGELRLWEAYSSTGAWGRPDHARLMFHCLTDPGRRARVLVRDADLAGVETELLELSSAALSALLEQAEELD